jgi:ELWxxDGT repeat protein
MGGTLFFSASDGTNGKELWRSDGTAAGTQIVMDIRTGSSGSYPYDFTNVGGTLFFSANDGTNGKELWRSDGTAAGTQIVKDINPGSSSSSPYYLTNVGGTLFFEANDGIPHGQELWNSNGTAAGTQMVADINPGSNSSYPQSLTNARGTLFFSANDGVGAEPWILEVMASPSITTAPNPTDVTLGAMSQTVTDSATLSGGNNPTGTITFTLYYNGGSSPVDTETASVSGNGTYTTPTGFTLPTTGTATGTYQWDASYSGDANNNAASDLSSPNEQVTVNPASPSITTTPSASSVTLGTTAPTLTDSATLSGGYFETGTITFTLYHGSTLVDTETATVTGNGNYTTPTGFTLPTTGTVTGSYQWDASYSGDANNNSASDNNDATEQVTVSPANLSITTMPNATSVSLGTTAPTLTDSATLSGGYFETGTITFTLYEGSTLVDTETATVTGNGSYTTPTGFTLPTTDTVSGTYQWDASYSGDTNNNSASDNNNATEQVTVSPASPSITTTPSPASVTLGTAAPTLTDSATLSGGYFETGTITFTLYHGSTLVDTETATVNGNGTYTTPTGFTLPTTDTVSGTYQWDASYSGDTNNNSASDNNNATEQVTVSPASPTITTTPNATSVSLGTTAPTLTDSATLSGGYYETGTITFTLYDGSALVDTETATVSGNGTYTTPTGFTLPTTGTVTGSYQWDASYSGDPNNNSVSDNNNANEQVTVSPANLSITTTPNATSVSLGTTAPTLTDSATLSGGYFETGTITFTLYHDSTLVDTETATVTGNGSYTTPAGYTLPTTGTVTGTYQWDASYSGDTNNNSASDDNNATEQVTVSPASPTITTTPNATSVMLGTTAPTLTDSAILSGGYYETGTITFTLYDGSTLVDTETATVSGNGTYTTPTDFTLPTTGTATGTFQWDASYSGDTNNNSASDNNNATEQVTVSPASPTITTTPNATSVVLGTTAPTLTDSATLSGGYHETGTITFTLYHGSTLVDTEAATVSGNGTYTTPTGFTLPTTGTVTGTFQWDASYSGDTNNNSVSDNNNTNEQVAVSPASPTITTTPNTTSVTLGTAPQTLTDSATLSGGYHETGTITFTLYHGSTLVDTETSAVTGNATYTTPTGFTLPTTDTATGVYQWDASYSGDTNNNPVSDNNNTNEQVTVSPASPTFTGLLVLNPTASRALNLVGNGNIHFPGVIQVDSSSATAINASGNSFLGGTAIDVVGNYRRVGNATISPTPVTGAAYQADPLAGLAGPSAAGLTNYGSVNVNGGSRTISEGIYSQINVSGNGSLTMSPGTYIIEGGGLTVSGDASITGQGVLIYNAGSNYADSGGNFGGITLSGNGSFNLSAPASGPFSGILIFQSRQNTRALSVSGNGVAGISGIIYAPNALLTISGNGQLQASLVVGTLNVSGNAALTQMAAGSDGSGDSSGSANTLLAGHLSVYVDNSNGAFTPDELARIQDTISSLDILLAPYSVTITLVNDPALASVIVDMGSSSACGTAATGVLGCYDGAGGEITLLQGWNWYAGADPSQVGPDQYDFQTTVTHEFGHAIGLGGATNVNSPMFETLAPGTSHRTMTVQDLNIPYPPEGADPLTAAGFTRDTGDLHFHTAAPFSMVGILANSATFQFNFGSFGATAGVQGNEISAPLVNPAPSASTTFTWSIPSNLAILNTGDPASRFRRMDDRSPQEGDMDSWMDALGLGCPPTGEWRKADGTGRRGATDSGDSSLVAPPHCSCGEHLSSRLSEVDEVFRHWGADGVLWDQGDFASPAADLSFAAAIALLGMVYDGRRPDREQPPLSKARENRLPGVP